VECTMTEPAYEYIEARRTLLDALDALESHHDNAERITDSATDSFGHSGTTRSSTSKTLILHPPKPSQEPRLARATRIDWQRARLAFVSLGSPVRST